MDALKDPSVYIRLYCVQHGTNAKVMIMGIIKGVVPLQSKFLVFQRNDKF